MMKKYRLLVCALAFAVLFAGCKRKPVDIDATATTKSEDYSSEDPVVDTHKPSFIVESVSVAKGDADVVVLVSLKNNPGFLTMAMDIVYDSAYMTLNEVASGSQYSDYYFVEPKNKQSGCTASWFLPTVPEKIVDGNILELHFSIDDGVESGSYPILIKYPENGGIVDSNKKEIIFNSAVGYVNIN